MEACQSLFSNHISNLIQQHIFPIAIGGGHDMSYGHFMGIWNVIENTKKRRVGIINFDAHFDLRPVETKSNSGTPGSLLAQIGLLDLPFGYKLRKSIWASNSFQKSQTGI